MPELKNFTPFPNFRYYSSDNEGREFGIVIVKATYEIDADGNLVVAEEQAPLMFTDACHGAVNESSLWHPSDLVPNKPRTDLIVNAVARAPQAEPAPSWVCGIRVVSGSGTILEKRLRVTGPRTWQPQWKRRLDDEERAEWQRHRKLFNRWELSEPEPAIEVPIRYEYGYGGTVTKGEDDEGKPVVECEVRNPLGRGLIDLDWTDHTVAQPAPQIEAEGEPIIDSYITYIPQSLGPIPPAWEPRLPLGGTYDQDWQDNVWPNWAKDYSFAFHNSAHPDLICPHHLSGGEAIELENLIRGEPEYQLILPDHGMVTEFLREDGSAEMREMVLDTVFLDIAGRRRGDYRIYLSWRVNFEPDVFTTARLITRADHDAVMQDVQTANEKEPVA